MEALLMQGAQSPPQSLWNGGYRDLSLEQSAQYVCVEVCLYSVSLIVTVVVSSCSSTVFFGR
jgi:hypothetical protein